MSDYRPGIEPRVEVPAFNTTTRLAAYPVMVIVDDFTSAVSVRHPIRPPQGVLLVSRNSPLDQNQLVRSERDTPTVALT